MRHLPSRSRRLVVNRLQAFLFKLGFSQTSWRFTGPERDFAALLIGNLPRQTLGWNTGEAPFGSPKSLIVFLMYWFCVSSCDANRCEIGQAWQTWQAWQAWQVWQAWKLAGQAFSLEYSFHVAGVVFKRHFLDDCVAIFNLEKHHETAQDIWEVTACTIEKYQWPCEPWCKIATPES